MPCSFIVLPLPTMVVLCTCLPADAVSIVPSAEGLSKVYYNKGKCDSKAKVGRTVVWLAGCSVPVLLWSVLPMWHSVLSCGDFGSSWADTGSIVSALYDCLCCNPLASAQAVQRPFKDLPPFFSINLVDLGFSSCIRLADSHPVLQLAASPALLPPCRVPLMTCPPFSAWILTLVSQAASNWMIQRTSQLIGPCGAAA